jgi:parvulin-like peptidyl-prolyl isomerase
MVDEIVVKVNNRIITRSEFDERAAYLVQQVQQQHSGAGFVDELQAARDALLANLITEALLIERAETIFDMDKIRGSLIDDFKKQQNIPNDNELEKALKDQGISRKELEDQLIRMAVPNEIINYDVKRKISVSDEEMEEYYTRNLAHWETPAQVTFHEIVLLYTSDNRDEVRARADAVVKQAKAGSADDFIELVKQYSEAGTRETQGLLGPVPRTDLQENIANVAFTIDPGTVSEPIDTGQTFHVIRLDARTPATTKTLADPAVKQEVHDQVRDEKYRPRFDVYLRKLWRENYIEVAPKYESYLVVSPLKLAPANEKNTTLPAAPPPGAVPAPESIPTPKAPPPADATTANATPPATHPPDAPPDAKAPDAKPPDANQPASPPAAKPADPDHPASPPDSSPPAQAPPGPG